MYILYPDPGGHLRSSSGPEHVDAEALGGIAQIGVLRCERDAEPHRQLQIGGGIGRQAFLACEIEHASESTCRRLFIDDDLEHLQQCNQFQALRRGNASAVLGQPEYIGKFQAPEARYRGGIGLNPLQ